MNYNSENELRIKSLNNDNCYYLDDTVLFFVFPFYEEYYLSLDINTRINFKSSFYRDFYARYFNF